MKDISDKEYDEVQSFYKKMKFKRVFRRLFDKRYYFISRCFQ